MGVDEQSFGDLSYPTAQLERMLAAELMFYRRGDRLVDNMEQELKERGILTTEAQSIPSAEGEV